MDSDRIHKIHKETAYPDSISVQQALFRVWNECSDQSVNKWDLYNIMMDIKNAKVGSCTCMTTIAPSHSHPPACTYAKLSNIHDALYNLMYGSGTSGK